MRSRVFFLNPTKSLNVKLIKIWKTLRIKILRLYVRINRKFAKKEAANETQQKAITILKRITVSPESELMVAPISGTFYVRWKEIFVKFEGDRVNIINGKYSYEVWLTLKQSDEMHSFFRHRMEARKKMMERAIMERTNRSLEDIINEIETEEKLKRYGKIK